ncbi:uncharacterized protein LOC142365714 [Opisthocomus hoazin]|uniref:uncharacterized protein LOC142365714 n=1 Tax=Opisthocomus hoazin TaxID=30419 RepID=UPI003F52E9BD
MNKRRWKAAVWSPTRQVAETAEGEGESSQFAEVKAIRLALDIAGREKWPGLYLYTDSWMVANALWGWLQQWKKNNWQRRGKPVWAAPLWQDIAARLEQLVVKVRHVDAHVPKSRATEEHQNNQQVDQAAKIEVAQVDLDWQHKVGELARGRFIIAQEHTGHQAGTLDLKDAFKSSMRYLEQMQNQLLPEYGISSANLSIGAISASEEGYLEAHFSDYLHQQLIS